ncbi:hypothetical protein GWK47_023741 [Chionoecetes opilio]|uniref:Uncharacterized protein n=1 Tax=Chionoecetes opilio TaxID=41210 RepID=A0A8J4XP15_CHIOP|nr:hypothetical protein GWK47_023741 [Chionoecetes opilio]
MKDKNRVVLLYLVSIILGRLLLRVPSATLSDVGEWDEVGRTQHSLVCSDGREDVVGSAKVNLTLSAARCHSFVIFSLFGREAEAAGRFPEQKSWCRTKKLMNQHIQQMAELPVTNFNHLSPLQSLCKLLLLPPSLSSQPLMFLDYFAMLSLATVSITIFSGPFGRRGSPVLLFEVGSWRKKWQGLRCSNSDAKWALRRGCRRPCPSGFTFFFSPSYELRTSDEGFQFFHIDRRGQTGIWARSQNLTTSSP